MHYTKKEVIFKIALMFYSKYVSVAAWRTYMYADTDETGRNWLFCKTKFNDRKWSADHVGRYVAFYYCLEQDWDWSLESLIKRLVAIPTDEESSTFAPCISTPVIILKVGEPVMRNLFPAKVIDITRAA